MIAKRQLNRHAVQAAIAFAAAYILTNFIFGPLISGFWGSYGLPFIMWITIIIFVWSLPRFRTLGKLKQRRLLRWLALICVFVGLLGDMVQGAMSGLGRSPYDHSLIGIIVNLLSLGAAVAGLEMLRSWAMSRFFIRRPVWGIGILSIMSTFFLIPFNRIINLPVNLAVAKFVGSEFLPSLAQNVLSSYLVLLGGPFPAVIYRGGILFMERLSPFLPNSNWVSQTLIGVLAPVLGIILVKQVYSEEGHFEKRAQADQNMLGWTMTSLAAILIIWFAMGVFSYSPRVILSGSMQPGINIGDIVIIHNVSGEDVRLNDVVLYALGNMKISHRVVAVKEVENKRFFITKGDANSEPDSDPVYEKQVRGKVVMVIPKLGWVTLWLRGIVS